jgi:hypothetical protein
MFGTFANRTTNRANGVAGPFRQLLAANAVS